MGACVHTSSQGFLIRSSTYTTAERIGPLTWEGRPNSLDTYLPQSPVTLHCIICINRTRHSAKLDMLFIHNIAITLTFRATGEGQGNGL